MERTNVTVIFSDIRTSNYLLFADIRTSNYLLYDKSHSKTHTTIIPFSVFLQILASPAKQQEK